MTAKVLIVVDLQRDFIGPHTDHLPALIETLTRAYPRVIATRFVNDPGSLWVTDVWRKGRVRRGWKLVQRVLSKTDDNPKLPAAIRSLQLWK